MYETNMQENNPQLGSQPNDLHDPIHTQSLESLFEQIDDEVPEFEFILKTLRPYVVRVLHIREDSKLLNEVLDFIDERVNDLKPDSTCTWRQLYTITRILNGNVIMIEGNEINETENAKCVPINDEIESQDTGSQKSENESLNEESDETTEADGIMEPELPLVQAEPTDDQEKADEILAGFDNEPTDGADLNDDFLSELDNMTVKQDERDEIDCGDGEFMKELEDFDPN